MADFAHEEKLAEHGQGPLYKRWKEQQGPQSEQEHEAEIRMPGGAVGTKRVAGRS